MLLGILVLLVPNPTSKKVLIVFFLEDINDVKDDIKEINKKLKIIIDEDLKVIEDKLVDNNDNTNNSIDNLIERDLLIDEVIKSIINRLDKNDNV